MTRRSRSRSRRRRRRPSAWRRGGRTAARPSRAMEGRRERRGNGSCRRARRPRTDTPSLRASAPRPRGIPWASSTSRPECSGVRASARGGVTPEREDGGAVGTVEKTLRRRIQRLGNGRIEPRLRDSGRGTFRGLRRSSTDLARVTTSPRVPAAEMGASEGVLTLEDAGIAPQKGGPPLPDFDLGFEPRADDCLLVIDVQVDFMPGGALAVGGATEVIPLVNALTEKFECVVLSQDWHPAGHSSFASQHEGKAPLETVAMPYGEQTLWPDHCVQGTEGCVPAQGLPDRRAKGRARPSFPPLIAPSSIARSKRRAGRDAPPSRERVDTSSPGWRGRAWVHARSRVTLLARSG